MPDKTPNHGLDRPDRGAQNWHNPLNRNFTRIDSKVEIRDSEQNRSQYDPANNAKFLATDTGSVYIGDGTEWNQIGFITGSGPAESGTVDYGTVYAGPGQVQSLIDEHSAGDQWGAQALQKIKLISGETYKTDSTWNIKPGTQIDFNGALVRPQGDFNVLKLHRNTSVRSPRINVANVDGFSSACIVVSGQQKKVGTSNPSTVHNCHLFNDENTGIGFLFLGDGNAVSMQEASGQIRNFDRGVEFRSNGSGWCNGNRFEGNINSARVAVYLNSTHGAAVSGNTVRGQVQCSEDTDWVIRQEDAAAGTQLRFNTYALQVWDAYQISNGFESASRRDSKRAPIWYIGTGQQEYNKLWSLTGFHSNQFILNRSTKGRNRNGIFNGAGRAASRGTVDFSHPPTYKGNDAPYHPES